MLGINAGEQLLQMPATWKTGGVGLGSALMVMSQLNTLGTALSHVPSGTKSS